MSSALRSALRVLAATIAALALLLSLAAAAITQPTFGVLAARGGLKADPDRLRRHVEFLSLQTSPRDSDHPEILDQAAAGDTPATLDYGRMAGVWMGWRTQCRGDDSRQPVAERHPPGTAGDDFVPQSGNALGDGMPSGGDDPWSPWPAEGCRYGPGSSLPPPSKTSSLA